MLQQEFINLLQNPGRINQAQTKDLQGILEEFPFFQAARAIRLKGLKNEESLHYNKELKITAAHTIDRSVLFDFITSKEFNQNEIAEKIKKQEDQEKEPDQSDLQTALKQKSKEIEEEALSKIQLQKAAEKHANSQAEIKNEETLQLGQPLSFKKEENHSFSEWLKLTRATPIEREKKSGTEKKQSRKFYLIDKFIAENPKIKPAKKGTANNLADTGNPAPEALMTETLARVYLEQKNYKKAITAYKILILKNPEKSGFFADQIRAIERIQEQNK